jgi:hypothetical protein
MVPGSRKIRITSFWHRSKTLELSLSAGDRVALECGYDPSDAVVFYTRAAALVFLLGAMMTPLLAAWPFWPRVAVRALTFASLCLAIDIELRPGSSLYLRAADAQPVDVHPPRRFLPPPPPMTLWRWMIVIAAIAEQSRWKKYCS